MNTPKPYPQTFSMTTASCRLQISDLLKLKIVEQEKLIKFFNRIEGK